MARGGVEQRRSATSFPSLTAREAALDAREAILAAREAAFDHAINGLAPDLAHELSQPLAATINYLGAARLLLSAGADTGEVRRTLDLASDQSLWAGKIIQRMRDRAAGSAAARRVELVEPMIREAAALACSNQPPLAFPIRYSFDPAARLVVADQVQVRQILVNLLRNGIEAMQAVPAQWRRIDVRTGAIDDGTMEIVVRDAGPGIPGHLLYAIGMPMASIKTNGMGIGLSISRRIAREHGGELTGWNHPDGGACFRLTLPMPPRVEPRTTGRA